MLGTHLEMNTDHTDAPLSLRRSNASLSPDGELLPQPQLSVAIIFEIVSSDHKAAAGAARER